MPGFCQGWETKSHVDRRWSPSPSLQTDRERNKRSQTLGVAHLMTHKLYFLFFTFFPHGAPAPTDQAFKNKKKKRIFNAYGSESRKTMVLLKTLQVLFICEFSFEVLYETRRKTSIFFKNSFGTRNAG